jgi:hypothetical protein
MGVSFLCRNDTVLALSWRGWLYFVAELAQIHMPIQQRDQKVCAMGRAGSSAQLPLRAQIDSEGLHEQTCDSRNKLAAKIGISWPR